MIRAHHDAPGIFHQQVPLQADGPLQRMDQALVLVFDRRDAAARLHFGIARKPLALIDIAQVIAQRAVAGHAGGLTEHYLAYVDRDVRMLVHVVCQFDGARIERVLIAGAAAIAMELDVGQVAAVPLERFHCFEGRGPIARQPEIVGMNVHAMGQFQLVGRAGDAVNDLPWRDVEMFDQRIQSADVAALLLFPDFDAARIDHLGGVPLGRRQ